MLTSLGTLMSTTDNLAAKASVDIIRNLEAKAGWIVGRSRDSLVLGTIIKIEIAVLAQIEW
jgi:hypothetical protein